MNSAGVEPPIRSGTSVARGLWLTVGGAFFAAVYLIPYKAATELAPADQVVLPMLLVAALLNSLPLVPGPWSRRPTVRWPSGLSLGVSGILGLVSCLGNEAVARALAHIAPGITAVVLRTQVVFVALGARLILGEPTTPRFWIGAALALGGMGMLRWSGNAATLTIWGRVWALVGAASFGSMQVVVRRFIHQIDPLLVNTLRLWLAAALLALLPGRVASLANTSATVWALCAGAALAGPILSRLLLMAALRHIPAALSSLALFTQPVFAYVLAAPVFGARPGVLEAAGCAVVLCGISLPAMEHLRRGG
jgi:drug/metabolite transporter (DMT)-like permease